MRVAQRLSASRRRRCLRENRAGSEPGRGLAPIRPLSRAVSRPSTSAKSPLFSLRFRTMQGRSTPDDGVPGRSRAAISDYCRRRPSSPLTIGRCVGSLTDFAEGVRYSAGHDIEGGALQDQGSRGLGCMPR